MGTEIKQVKRVDILKRNLNSESVSTQISNALKNNAGPFIASVIDLFNSDTQLQECEPNALINEALKAAVLQLPINKSLGFAYIVPFNCKVKEEQVNQTTGALTVVDKWKKVPTFIIGWKGFVQLAMRTGFYKFLNADVVYEGEIGSVNKLTGGIDFGGTKTSDKIVGYFCYFELINGFSKTLYMTVEEMAKYAKKYSKGLAKTVTVQQLIALANSEPSGGIGWTGNFQEMALKTVVRRLLSKYGYLSIEMSNALSTDTEEGGETQPPVNNGMQDINPQDVPFSEVKEGTQEKDTTSEGPGNQEASEEKIPGTTPFSRQSKN